MDSSVNAVIQDASQDLEKALEIVSPDERSTALLKVAVRLLRAWARAPAPDRKCLEGVYQVVEDCPWQAQGAGNRKLLSAVAFQMVTDELKKSGDTQLVREIEGLRKSLRD